MCIALAAGAFETFLLLSLGQCLDRLSEALLWLAFVGGTVLNAAVLALDLVGFFLRKEPLYKFCISAYILGVFAVILIYILLLTGFFDIIGDQDKFIEYLEQAGPWMAALFVLLQFLQVVILPIPSTLTVAAGTFLFGSALNVVYSLTGIVLGSVCAFLIGRYAGHKAVAWIVGKETLEKWLKKIEGKDKLVLSAMFLLPVFPDDVLCFVAGLSSMSFLFFIIVISVSRVLAITATSYLLEFIPLNTWWGLLTWGLFFAVLLVAFVFLYRHADELQERFFKKLRRETRVKEETKKDEFTLEVVDPDGHTVEKGVKKNEEHKT